MRKMILGVFLLAFIMTQDVFSGYLKSTEVSFCMDDCSQYYIQPEMDFNEPYFVVFNENVDIEMYLERFVEIVVSDQEINCIECSAFQVLEISLSQDCEFPVACFADPCDVAEECQLNTPVDCVSNYCGGCYADFYDLNNNLVYCSNQDEENIECSDIDNFQECYSVGCEWEYSNNMPSGGFCFESDEEDDNEGEESPCSDFGQEDCEWFDECIWTDSGCQDWNWEEDGCSELTQDECFDTEGCQWDEEQGCYRWDEDNDWDFECENIDNQEECNYLEGCEWEYSNNMPGGGYCSYSDEEDEEENDGPPECVLDCEGIEDVDPEENGMYFCEWLLTVFPSGCAEDCEQEILDEIEEFMRLCDECLPLENCDEYFGDNEEDWVCSDIENPEECNYTEGCQWEYNPTGTGQCIEGDGFEPVCEDLSDYLFGPCDMIIGIGWNGQECTWYSGCGPVDQNGIDHSDSFFDSFEECEARCLDNQPVNGVLYGMVEYIWGDAIELVAGALIQITSPNMFYVTETNDQGFYEIELPEGEYVVNVQAYDEYQVQNIDIVGNYEHELNFTFGEFYYETALAGNVSCGNCPNDYAPISDAYVMISSPNQLFSMETYTNEEGFFWASLPSPGMYHISISADGYSGFDDYVYVEGIYEMSFFLNTDNSGESAVLELGNVVGSAGMEVSVPLFLESNLAVAGVQFSVNYNSATGAYLYPSGFNSADDCFTANFNDLDGEFIGIVFSLEGCSYPAFEYVHIADLIFEVSDSVPSGFEAFLGFNSTLVSDIVGDEISSYGQGGSILFGSLGDVNSDGVLNILDVVLIVNFAIYIEEPTDSQFWASDINGDDVINILDIVQIVNMILEN